MSVAREKLPREHLKEVVNACLQTLREVQRQSYDTMAAEWASMDVEMLCATINDTYRMEEKSKEFSEVVRTVVLLATCWRCVGLYCISLHLLRQC